MLDAIESQYAGTLTLRTLSESVGRQPAYLGRLFQQEVGLSFREYLTRVRLGHAADLIREGVKIEAVALSVGYRSKKNFYQQFKRLYGTTPLSFRRGGEPAATPRRHEKHEARGRFYDPRPVAIAADSSPSRRCHDEDAIVRDSDLILANLGSVVRASNRAWHLAVRIQGHLLRNFSELCLGIFLTNDEGRYIAANRVATAATGYSTAELSEVLPTALFANAANLEVRRAWQLLLLRPRPQHKANAMLHPKSGDTVAVHVVTLRNLWWGRREMVALLQRLQLTDRETAAYSGCAAD